MPLIEWTPLRQLARAYGSLLSIAAAADELPKMRRSLGELADIRRALQAQAAPAANVLAPVTAAEPAPAPEPAAAHRLDIHSEFGLRLLLDRESMVDRHVLESGDWEREQLDYMAWLTERLRGKGRTLFLDIGSYWGLYTLLAHRSGAFDRLVAVEADRHNFAQLQANLLLNGAAKSVACVNKAASHDCDDLHFMDSAQHPDGNRAGAGVLPPDSELPSYVVPATTVDALVTEQGAYILGKIDVEGFEAYVLRGMAETVRNNKVVLQVEIFELNKEAADKEIAQLGLRQIHALYPDYYLTNMSADELGV